MASNSYKVFAEHFESPEDRKKRLQNMYGDKIKNQELSKAKTVDDTQSSIKAVNTQPKKVEHTHPSYQTDNKIEKAHVESTAENTFAGQGCQEHYLERVVANEQKDNDVSLNFDNLTELQKIIVLGDILNNPLWKN